MKDLINFEKTIALLSFIIGTITLSLFLFFKKDSIVNFGMYYVLIACIINGILLAINIVVIFIDTENRLEFLKTSGLMLINIPIAISYFFVVIWSFGLGNTF